MFLIAGKPIMICHRQLWAIIFNHVRLSASLLIAVIFFCGNLGAWAYETGNLEDSETVLNGRESQC